MLVDPQGNALEIMELPKAFTPHGRIRGCTAKYFAVRAGNLASRAEHRVNRRPVQAEKCGADPASAR
jgi:hypothetical protein